MNNFINLNETKKTDLVFDKSGEYVVFFHNLSGKVTVDLAAKDVNVDIIGLYTGKGSDQFVIETVQRHTAPSTTSNLFIKGVFADQSRFNYQGLIRIEKGGQQSHAYQRNQNLIMSPGVFVESKPYLEILANDVFCTHGSTTGKLNTDELYYVQSRGIEKEAAKKLLVEGFINEVFDKVKSKVPNFSFRPLSS